MIHLRKLLKHYKRNFAFFCFLLVSFPRPAFNNTALEKITKSNDELLNNYIDFFFDGINDSSLNKEAFTLALKGFFNLKTEEKLINDTVLSIIDYSLSSTVPRFFLIDLKNCELISKSLVSHGKNSGEEFALRFSNEINSYKSPIGFFITAETYQGIHGNSLRLDGIEENINHNSRKRDIVIHGAAYSDENTINELGYLGRSLGCPALPINNSENIIEKIKECSCLFIYYPDSNYVKNSPILEAT